MRYPFLITLLSVLVLSTCKPKKQSVALEATGKTPVATGEVPSPPPDSSATAFDKYGLKVEDKQVTQYRVQKNESFYLILEKLGFNPQQIYSITHETGELMDVRDLRPGQQYRVYHSDSTEKQLSQLVIQPNRLEYVVFDWEREDSLQIYKASRPLTTKTAVTTGEIQTSLYHTISSQKVSPVLGYKMSRIFAWQIDFFRLREGDRFKALYRNRYVDEQYLGVGEILAAEFEHRGETFRAYRFKKGEIDGYYTEEGQSVQKALLKAPFTYDQRISSGFSRNRMHPILDRRMPHLGVDYAAPRGTPVLAVGNGEIIEAQYRGANGNIAKIRHNSTYTTVYLHLNGFASGIRRGVRVKQGQIIGYVGSTGRSTGPHLDYRIYKHDRPVNPLTIDLPSSESIPDSLMAEFEEVKKSLDLQWQVEDHSKDQLITQQGAETQEEIASRTD